MGVETELFLSDRMNSYPLFPVTCHLVRVMLTPNKCQCYTNLAVEELRRCGRRTQRNEMAE